MIHIVCSLCEYHEARDKITVMPPCYKCNSAMILDPEFSQEDPEFEGFVFDLDNREDDDENTTST